MPDIKVIDTTPNKPEPTGVEQFFSKLSKSFKERQDENTLDTLISEYQGNREKANAWEDLQLNLEKSTIAPTRRLQAQESLNATKKTLIEEEKALNAKFRAHALTREEREAQKQNLVKTGMPEWEAEAYLDAPPGVKSRIQAYHLEQVGRGLRTPLPGEENQPNAQNATTGPSESPQTAKPSEHTPPGEIAQPGVSDQPVMPTEATAVEGKPLEGPKREEWPEIAPPKETTAAEREKGRAVNQKENSKILQENKKKVTAIRDDQILIRNMQQINDTGKLPKGGERWITVDPKTGDVTTVAKLSGKVNPETQAYIKDINKFIKHAKDYFGARVTNFDLQSFMAQLPTLTNTEQGRRLILKQMQQESELQGLYANKVDEAIKHYGRNANIIDISNVVDEQIKDQEDALIKRMNLTVEASGIMDKMAKNPKEFKGKILIEKGGEFLSIPQEDLAEAQQDGWSEF